MSSKLLVVFLVLILALAGCESDGSPEAGVKAPPAEAGAQAIDQAAPEAEAALAEAPEPAPIPPAPEMPEADQPAQAAAPVQADQPAASPDDDGSAVVATVNGRPITRQILESQLALVAAERLAFGQRDDLSEAEREELDLYWRTEILSNLISLELVSQEAERLGYAPSDEEAAREWADLKKAYEKPESLQALLDQYGYTEDDLRAQLRRTLAVKKWRENNFLAQIKADDQEARAFYDQHLDSFRHGDMVRISQIFLSIPLVGTSAQKEKARTEAQAKAETVFQVLKQGIDFGTVAAEMSDDPEAVKNRGDLGWMSKDQPLPVFDPAVFEMEPGQVSSLMESPLGFYIFKVTETKPAGLEPFEGLRADIIDYLSEEKLEKVVGDKVVELFQKGDIQILDPKLKNNGSMAKPADSTDPADPAGPTGGEPDPEPQAP